MILLENSEKVYWLDYISGHLIIILADFKRICFSKYNLIWTFNLVLYVYNIASFLLNLLCTTFSYVRFRICRGIFHTKTGLIWVSLYIPGLWWRMRRWTPHWLGHSGRPTGLRAKKMLRNFTLRGAVGWDWWEHLWLPPG